MSPKEKAIELVNKFLRTYKVSLFPPFTMAYAEAKQCALIAVDEIIQVIKPIMLTGEKLEYWKKVKEEINKLTN